MLSCWWCHERFDPNAIHRLAMMKGRDQSHGGPFRSFRCPSCQRESKVEVTHAGRMFASPAKDMGLADFLFGWIEPLSPDDMLEVMDWHERNAERRRHFFERDGDRRYSRWRLLDWLRSLWPRRPVGEAERVERVERRSSDVAPARAPVSHPYRVLGLESDATEVQVREAFRRLARRYHPDKLRVDDAAVLARASHRLAELVSAYETLSRRRSRDSDESL